MMRTCLSSFMCLVPVEAEEGISTPGTRVTDECEPLFHVENQSKSSGRADNECS